MTLKVFAIPQVYKINNELFRITLVTRFAGKVFVHLFLLTFYNGLWMLYRQIGFIECKEKKFVIKWVKKYQLFSYYVTFFFA